MDRAGDRVVVMRTFSKIYGMAGIGWICGDVGGDGEENAGIPVAD